MGLVIGRQSRISSRSAKRLFRLNKSAAARQPAAVARDAGLLTIRPVNAAIPESRRRPRAGRADTYRPRVALWDERSWRERLAAYQRFLRNPVVNIADPRRLSRHEHRALSARIDAANMALYRVRAGVTVDHDAVLALGRQFGLCHPGRHLCAARDAVSNVTPREDERGRYIPYTRRALSWHTDGYYEAGGVRAFILHCVRQAVAGGGNRFLDHEILHGLLERDAGIDLGALYDEDAFVIPANVVDGVEIRGAVSGAVFDRIDGALTMRYSARQRHIAWKDDARTHAATSALARQLTHSPLVCSQRLEPGMGIICRNVPHCREAFVDEPGAGRLLMRTRYPQAITPAALSANADDLAE